MGLFAGAVLLLILAAAGCGAASLGPSGDVPTSGTTVPNTLTTSGPPTTLSSTAKPPGSITTVLTSSERVPVLTLADVAFVEISNPNADVTGPGDRLLLSPVGDSAEVQPLVDAYAEALIPVGVTPNDFLYRTLIFHLLDGRALSVRWNPDTPDACLVELYDGAGLTAGSGDALNAPVWSHVVVAPRLVELGQQSLDLPRDGAGATGLPADMPEDFGFIAGFSVYGKDVLDTFAGTFQKDMGLPLGTTATAVLRLNPAQLEQAYTDFLALDILSYPTDYAPHAGMWVSPTETHYLRVMAGGVEKEIRWEEGTLSEEPEAIALRDWFEELRLLIYQTPEYKALPVARGFYQ